MAFHTEKDLKSRNVMGKKVFILAKDVNTERNLELKSQKKIGLKKAYLCSHPNSGSCVQNA